MNLHPDSVRYALVPRSTVLPYTVRKARVLDVEETRYTNAFGGCSVIVATSCARAQLSVFAWRFHERSWAFSRVRVSISAVACTECSAARVSYPPALIRPPLALPLNFHESGVLAARTVKRSRVNHATITSDSRCVHDDVPPVRGAGRPVATPTPARTTSFWNYHEFKKSWFRWRIAGARDGREERGNENVPDTRFATGTRRGLVASRLTIVFCPRRFDLAGRGTYTNISRREKLQRLRLLRRQAMIRGNNLNRDLRPSTTR